MKSPNSGVVTEIRGRVPAQLKADWETAVVTYGRTNEGLLAALVAWFLRQPDAMRKFVASGLTAEEFGDLSAQAELAPAASKPPETPASPAVRHSGRQRPPGPLKRAKDRQAARERKEA